jgi:hypothetical protein
MAQLRILVAEEAHHPAEPSLDEPAEKKAAVRVRADTRLQLVGE